MQMVLPLKTQNSSCLKMSQHVNNATDIKSGTALPLPLVRTHEKCNLKPTFEQAILQNACPRCPGQTQDPFPPIRLDGNMTVKEMEQAEMLEKPENLSSWYWDLKQRRFGCPPTASQFRTAKYRWDEQTPQPCQGCHKRKQINPYESKTNKPLSGGTKRKIVERWGKMWDSALSDLQFDRIVFENNPDAEQTYKSEKDRIDDGCRKLRSIAKMNPNIITMMMKKFVSGPPNKLYTLNRIEAAQCWDRIVDDRGLIKEECCVDLPHEKTRDYNIPSLKVPKALKHGDLQNRPSFAYKFPRILSKKSEEHNKMDTTVPQIQKIKKRSSTYWLNPKVVPPVPAGFKDEEFYIDAKYDPTGEIRRDLKKAKEIARRYTRFAHIIEKAVPVIPNLDRLNEIMDENFVADDPEIRRQTLIHNFFSSKKMDTSPEFRRDALYATILSRNDNPKDTVTKKPFPYILAEMSKSKSKAKTGN